MNKLLAVFTFIFGMITQILVSAQGFEFIYPNALDSNHDATIRFQKVFFEEEILYLDVRHSNDSAELLKFNTVSNTLIKKVPFSKNDYQGIFYRANLKEYQDSLLLLKRYLNEQNTMTCEIVLIDKEFTGERSVYKDSVYDIGDFVLNNDNELTILGVGETSTHTYLCKMKLPDQDTLWTLHENFEGTGFPQISLYVHENDNGELLVTGTGSGGAGVKMTYLDEDQNFTPVYDFQWAFATSISTGGPMFLKNKNGEPDGFAVVHHEADYSKDPYWLDGFFESVSYGYLKLRRAEDIFPKGELINDDIYSERLANPEVMDFTYHNGYYYYCGYLGGNFLNERGFLLKMSEQGELIYFKTYQYKNHPFNEIIAMHLVDDDNLVLAGLTWEDKEFEINQLEKKNNSAWVFNVCPNTGDKMKTNPECDINIGVDEKYTEHKTNISIYPNPVSSTSLKIESDNSISSVEIYSLNGRLIFSEKFRTNSISIPSETFENINGVYVCKITFLNGTQHVEKIIAH